MKILEKCFLGAGIYATFKFVFDKGVQVGRFKAQCEEVKKCSNKLHNKQCKE